MISRRRFLKISAMAAAGVMLPIRFVGRGQAYAFSQSPLSIRKFVVPLPGLGPTGIPALTPKTAMDPKTGLVTDFYSIQMAEFTQQLHPDLPLTGTKLWGYSDAANPVQRYLGGAIVAKKGRPIKLKVKNKLPNKHPLPVDTSIMGAEKGQPVNRAAVHLHGGFTPWTSDGVPFSWFTPAGGPVGETFLNPGDEPGTAEHYYPNNQSARLAWYHDHAMGITRLNAYAGLASAYIIRDDFETKLINSLVIPSNEIPLIIQDKTFVNGKDPHYKWGKKGDLWYPYLYEKNLSTTPNTGRWDYGPDMTPPAIIPNPTLPTPAEIPEFFSDTMLINGTCYPFLEVQPRHYRFRMLNGSQARFYNLQLYYADATGNEANLAKPGPRMVQIGTEGGFLPFPVALNSPPVQLAFDPVTGNAIRYNLLLAPAERADIIIDFSNVPVGAKLILYSDAPAPFPGGDPLNDYITNGPDQTAFGGAPSTKPGMGPNTQTLMQFRVVPRVGKADPATMGILELLAVKGGSFFNNLYNNLLPAAIKCDTKKAARVRVLTLNEDFDDYGRLIQTLGTNVQNGLNNQGLATWGRGYMDASTENPNAGDTEIWQICNLTGDTHPIHFHLVNVNVLSRQPFDTANFNGTPVYTGPKTPPDANEEGWKETVRMNPGEVTTVVMKFDLPKVPFHIPISPRTGGHEYVWHCHILEHEEHDMMRPLVVQP
jgi:spore coat protein A, manganese oxidase